MSPIRSMPWRLGLVVVGCLMALAWGAVSASADPAPAAPGPIDAKVEIVWPHNNAPVSAADKVNITAYLFQAGGLTPVDPGFGNNVQLWRALNSDPAQPVGGGSKRMIDVNGKQVPVWDFNDIDVSAAKDPANKYYFFVTVDGAPSQYSVWSHGADGRTILPQPVLPTATKKNPKAVDARVSVVWPHDKSGNQQGVTGADLANVTVRVFEQGNTNSVPTSFNNGVRLLRSVNNGPFEVIGTGQKSSSNEGGVDHPVWTFNDVDVSAARNPANKVYFSVAVDGLPSHTTVWSHASDARSYVPNPDAPFGEVVQAAPPPPPADTAAVADTSAPAAPAAPAGPVAAPKPGGVGFDYGIQGDFISDGNHDRAMGAVNQLGFNWIKQQVEWKRFEPSKGNIAWGDLDRLVNDANAKGLNVLFSVVKAPAWARPADDRSVDGPPANPQDFANFMAAVANRYQGKVQAYEIWNEQNLWYEWGGRDGRIDPARYMALLRAAYNAVKSNDPNAIVISGAPTPTGVNDGNTAVDDQAYLQAMYANGLRGVSDCVGVHPSGFNNPPNVDWTQGGDGDFKGHPSFFFRSTMEGYRNIMVANGDRNKKLCPTEFGWASVQGLGAGPAAGYGYAAQISEGLQAQYITQAYQMARNWGWVGPMFLWNLNFAPVSGAADEKAAFGIVRPNWSHRAAFDALAGMGK
ncbi:MAG: hypothetical protein U0641_16600 [Anaerolineae bacterium]